MKKILFVLVAMLFASLVFSQNSAVKITNQKTGTTRLFKEKTRIRIKTVEGKRITGRFQILNDSTMLVKGKVINLSEIAKIKRNPLLMTVATDVVLFYTAAVAVAIIAFAGGTAPAAIFGVGATFTTMILGPNVLKGYTTGKNTLEFLAID